MCRYLKHSQYANLSASLYLGATGFDVDDDRIEMRIEVGWPRKKPKHEAAKNSVASLLARAKAAIASVIPNGDAFAFAAAA